MIEKLKERLKKHKYLYLYLKTIALPFRKFYLKNLISDERLLKKLYKKEFGKQLNLENPQTFNEKLQYLKLIQKDEKFSILTDKYRVREYVREKIGEEALIPLLWVGERPEDIPYNNLPNKFVIKVNHDSGGVIIVPDKRILDKKWVTKELKYHLKTDYYLYSREYNYKNIPKKILIEEYLEPEDDKGLIDYKIFCFDGNPKFLFVATDRNNPKKGGTKFDFYDINFKKIPVKQHYPNSNYYMERPPQLDKMLEYSKKLSEGLSTVRIDFYINKGKVYFGEMTFYHFGGLKRFEPEKYDYLFGTYIKL